MVLKMISAPLQCSEILIVSRILGKDHHLIDARGAHGIPLLYFPVIHAHQHIADFLLQHGADPNADSPGGITPLYGAALFNQSLLAHWLLEHGADPNPRVDSKTPLTVALGKNHSQLVDILRAFGGSE
jgi:ankyrin repeat protein